MRVPFSLRKTAIPTEASLTTYRRTALVGLRVGCCCDGLVLGDERGVDEPRDFVGGAEEAPCVVIEVDGGDFGERQNLQRKRLARG